MRPCVQSQYWRKELEEEEEEEDEDEDEEEVVSLDSKKTFIVDPYFQTLSTFPAVLGDIISSEVFPVLNTVFSPIPISFSFSFGRRNWIHCLVHDRQMCYQLNYSVALVLVRHYSYVIQFGHEHNIVAQAGLELMTSSCLRPLCVGNTGAYQQAWFSPCFENSP